MKHAKRFFAFVLAAAIVGSNIYLFGSKAEAADNVLVFVNNNIVNFKDVPAQIINERVMVPVRALGEAMGASVEWNADEQKVTLVSDDRYAVLKIGVAVMSYGAIAVDEEGRPAPATTEQYTLDSPPVIVDERSLFPTRAIAEAFNCEVEWVGDSSSVYITTYAPRPSDMDSSSAPVQATPAASTGPANPVFKDTEYFQEVSGKRLEDMHLAKMNFATVIYSGTDSSAVSAMPLVTNAAASAKFKVYGFDRTSDRFPNPENLKWVWSMVDKSSTNYPIIILSYEGEFDELLPSDISESELTAKLANLKTDYPLLNVSASPNPTSSAYASSDPWASPSPSPTSSASANYRWSSLTPRNAEDNMWNQQKFIYVVYDSSDSYYSSRTIEDIKEAAQNVGAAVYYYDIRSSSTDDVAWIKNNYGGDSIPNPYVLFIMSRGIDSATTSISVSSMEREFEWFMNRT